MSAAPSSQHESGQHLHGVFSDAWGHLTEERRATLVNADPLVRRVALETAAAVADTLKTADLEPRPVCAKRAEKDVLELAARELNLLVLHTASSQHALDGQIPLQIVSGRGTIGIEVKSGVSTISTEEVDKFRNDLAMGPFVVGVFVSLRAPIMKIPRGIHVQRELSTCGAIIAVYVSPVGGGESAMVHLTRGALSLACILAKQRHGRLGEPLLELAADDVGESGAQEAGERRDAPPSGHPDWKRERELDLAEVNDMVRKEVSTLGIVRKRLRDEEENFHRRVDRAVDTITGVQHRLAASTANIGLRLSTSECRGMHPL